MQTAVIIFIMKKIIAWLRPMRVCLGKSEKCSLLVLPPTRRCHSCRPSRNKSIEDVEKSDKKLDLEEVFAAMKHRFLTQEAKEGGSNAKEPVTQEEVLEMIGLRRTNHVDSVLRKSKRERRSNAFDVEKREDRQEEVSFLKENWPDVQALYCENLHFGTYTCMGHKKLVDAMQRTFGLLSRWHVLTEKNPGFLADVNLPSTEPLDLDAMSANDLRLALSASVRDVKRLKAKFKSVSPLFRKLLNSELSSRTKEIDVDTLIDEAD